MRVLPHKPSKAHRPRSGQPYSMPDQKIFGSARNSCSQLRVLLPERDVHPFKIRALARFAEVRRRSMAQDFDTTAMDQGVCRKAQEDFCEEP